VFAASMQCIVYSSYRFVIPEDSFSDLEDGNTRNLRLIFKTAEGTSVAPTSWLQFNPKEQEVYGL
jgi:neurexin